MSGIQQAADSELHDAVTDLLPLGDVHGLAVLDGDSRPALLVTGVGRALRPARPGDGAVTALVRWWQAGAASGRFAPRWLAPSPAAVGRELAVSTDQANASAATGEVLVKLQSRLQPGDHPAAVLPLHLGQVGFDEHPELLGTLEWSGPNGAALAATATRYLPGATDGWRWCRDLVLALVGGRLEASAAIAPAASVGRLVARLHAALATASPLLPAPVSVAVAADAEAWHAQAIATLDMALEATEGEEGSRLRDNADRMVAALAPLAQIASTPVMRIHGDLHIGQVLSHADRHIVSDFDGDPLASISRRSSPQPAARDVAALLRSLDHVGRVADRRSEGRRTGAIEAWIAAARAACIDAYRTELAARGHAALADEQLVLPFEVEQACHEYVYAAQCLPSWRYVPHHALPALLPGGGGSRPDGLGGGRP